MYRIFVAAAEFQGKRTIQQHRIINDVSDFFSLKRFRYGVGLGLGSGFEVRSRKSISHWLYC